MTGRAPEHESSSLAAGGQAALIGAALAVAVLACQSHPGHAAPVAEVTVSVEIPPIARVEFPDGAEIKLRIPERPGLHRAPDARHVRAGRIPFILRGNAAVTVHAQPGELVRVPRDAGATRRLRSGRAPEDEILSYRLRLELPDRRASGQPRPRGRNPTWGGGATFDMSQGPLFGFLHVVVESPTRALGSSPAAPAGTYRGTISLTVTPQDD